MGIFSKGSQKPSRDKSIKKRAQVCADSFSSNMYKVLTETMQEVIDSNPEVSEFGQKKKKVLISVETHLAHYLTQWDEQVEDAYRAFENWGYYADAVHYSRFSYYGNEPSKLSVEEIIDQVKYLHQSVKSGSLVMMPGASLDKSRGYRGYLSANIFSDKMGWHWKNWSDSDLGIADHIVAQLVADSVTEIFDKYQLSSESGFAGLFASYLLKDWDSSRQRQHLL
jgi:hypothetical protein